ncbi:MAG: phosphohistidine phosphatase SixA [Acidimicrobiales bacterium]
MPLFLIRHAVAGVRNNLDLSDDQRPLDQVGRSQAQTIAEAWTELGIEAIYSSPALRCVQTVEPLAERFQMAVQIAPELFEGASTSRSIEYIRSFTGRSVVLCSHGDVIPDVLRNLEVGGSQLQGRGCAKGSIWQLDNSTDRIESGIYQPQPDCADGASPYPS